MKNVLILLCFVFGLLLCSCSHNTNLVGIGKVLRIGGEGCSITYVNGLFSVTGTRENAESVIETNDGDSITDPSAVLKSVRSIRFRTGPQITGYLVDLSKKDPEAAKAYVATMAKLNANKWDTKSLDPIDVPVLTPKMSPEARSKATQDIKDPFTCEGGNCEFTDMSQNRLIAYQTAIVYKLLTYCDDTTTFPDSEITFKHSLNSFLTRMAKLSAQEFTKTQLRVKRFKIKDQKLVDLMFVMDNGDGTEFETDCPECVSMDDGYKYDD